MTIQRWSWLVLGLCLLPCGVGQAQKPQLAITLDASTTFQTIDGFGDQSTLLEREIGWRSTRRLLKFLNEGLSAGLVWDAFDNFHEHDAAWSTYGLLATDRNAWKYSPKPRYCAAKQVFRFVRPGFVRVAANPADRRDKSDPYANWRDPHRHLLLSAFVSPDRKDFSMVGMSRLEVPCVITVALSGLGAEVLRKPVHCYQTNAEVSCEAGKAIAIGDRGFVAEISPRTVFTLTTCTAGPEKSR